MEWVRSSLCESATCVEVTFDGGQVGVRNSACPADVLWFTPQEWEAFALGASQGDFQFWTKGDKA